MACGVVCLLLHDVCLLVLSSLFSSCRHTPRRFNTHFELRHTERFQFTQGSNDKNQRETTRRKDRRHHTAHVFVSSVCGVSRVHPSWSGGGAFFWLLWVVVPLLPPSVEWCCFSTSPYERWCRWCFLSSFVVAALSSSFLGWCCFPVPLLNLCAGPAFPPPLGCWVVLPSPPPFGWCCLSHTSFVVVLLSSSSFSGVVQIVLERAAPAQRRVVALPLSLGDLYCV